MTKRGKLLFWAAAVPVFVASFGSAYALATPSAPRARMDRALEVLRADPDNLVCLGQAPCLDPEAEHTLFVFFGAYDCAVGLYQTAVLEQVYRTVPRRSLNVVGVAQGFSARQARKFAVASGISYPIYADPARLDGIVPNPKPTDGNRPVFLLVDRRGRVLQTRTAASHVAGHHADAAALARRLGAG
jgi:hypothetical protein